MSRNQIVDYFIKYYYISENSNLTEKILNFIIETTKILFDLPLDNHDIYGEFQSIGLFWKECTVNYIDIIFTKFECKVITSSMRKNEKDIDYQYRKEVLLYCTKIATNEQRIRIIKDIEDDIKNELFSDNEIDEIHSFLAALGRDTMFCPR